MVQCIRANKLFMRHYYFHKDKIYEATHNEDINISRSITGKQTFKDMPLLIIHIYLIDILCMESQNNYSINFGPFDNIN